MRRVALTTASLVALTALPGCDTTAQRSAELAAQSKTIATERGVEVAKVNTAVRVVDSATLTDANGSAVVVTVRATGTTALASLPIAIDVRDAAGKTIFRNDTPGAEPALVSLPVLSPGRSVTWVHDQVQAAGAPPARVVVRVGASRATAPRRLPRLTVSALALESDPTSGVEGAGRVTNDSAVPQRRLTIYAVARRGSKVVAAGRAVINRVGAGRSAGFSVFFIGDPRGARLTVTAPPTALR